jgi:hypothetical protein
MPPARFLGLAMIEHDFQVLSKRFRLSGWYSSRPGRRMSVGDSNQVTELATSSSHLCISWRDYASRNGVCILGLRFCTGDQPLSIGSSLDYAEPPSVDQMLEHPHSLYTMPRTMWPAVESGALEGGKASGARTGLCCVEFAELDGLAGELELYVLAYAMISFVSRSNENVQNEHIWEEVLWAAASQFGR